MFRYPHFCSAVFCSKPAEGSGRQRKCAKREVIMHTCAFWLSSKGKRKAAWMRRKAARRTAEEARMGQQKCARAAKIRKGSAHWQRKCAMAAKMRISSAQLCIFAVVRCFGLPFAAPLPILLKTSGARVAKHSGAHAFYPPSSFNKPASKY